MIQIPNGCKCSEPKVNPSNWESSKAPIRKNWYIYYRFYDPRELHTLEMQELKGNGLYPISEVHHFEQKFQQKAV